MRGGSSVPSALSEKVKPAVVRIQGGAAQASGFVVDPSGLVITNCQALNGASQVNVVFHDGTTTSAAGYLGVDIARDIIVLKADAGRPLASLSLKADPPKPRELVYAFGASRSTSQSVMRGLVESVQTSQQCQAAYQETTGRFRRPADALWIRVTAAVFGDNWGGPLVDEQGQVVGINSRTKTTGQSLNFAISSQDIAKLLSESSANEIQSLANLPRSQTSGTGGMQGTPDNSYDGFPAVQLPTGPTLSHAAVRVPDDWPDSKIT